MAKKAMRHLGHGSFFDLISNMAKKFNMEDRKLFCIICWRLWCLRNDFVHNGRNQQYLEVFPWSCKYAMDCKIPIREAIPRDVGNNRTDLQWMAPVNGCYKANCSAVGGKDGYKTGVKFSLDCGLRPCIFESDKTIVMKRIINRGHSLASYGHILDEIEVLKRNNPGTRFRSTSSVANLLRSVWLNLGLKPRLMCFGWKMFLVVSGILWKLKDLCNFPGFAVPSCLAFYFPFVSLFCSPLLAAVKTKKHSIARKRIKKNSSKIVKIQDTIS
ncbi:hypothetical protein Q3G72_006803 [Acer saccharum]|nr:hypothetical protein Q3G72_006803 [Acer saccharum]